MGQCFLYGNGGKDRLKLRIFGQTTPPPNPKNNDIWVNTSIPIGGWEFSEVSNPTWGTSISGCVYFTSTYSGAGNAVTSTGLNFLKEWTHAIYTKLLSCSQYDGSSWLRKDAYIYHDKWIQFSSTWNGELFDNGNQYADVTGGWVGNGISSTTVGTNLSLIVANTSPYLTTKNAIDLSGYSKLHMIADRNAGQYSYFGISSNVPSNAGPNYIASATFIGGENVLDVSAINSGHISIGATASWGVTINISKVWLE